MVSCCEVAATVAQLIEFTIFDLFINEPGQVRIKARYPLITYCDSHVTSDAQQRCTIISFVMMVVGVAVTGIRLVVMVIETIVTAILLDVTGVPDRGTVVQHWSTGVPHWRPTQEPVE